MGKVRRATPEEEAEKVTRKEKPRREPGRGCYLGRRKKNTPNKGRKASPQKRRPFSNAPPPIIPVGGGWRLPRPKRTQMPLDWPPNYPNDLIPQTTVIIGEELKEHPVQTETLQLCTSVISKLTPYFCAAVKSKTLRPDLVLYVMGGLLDCLLVYNCDDPSEMYRLKKKAMNSDEWLKLAGEIARVSSVGRPQDQPGETTGHKDAKHAKEPKQGKSFEIGSQVDSLIPHCREGLTLLRKAKAKHPTAKHIWKGELLQKGFSDIVIDVLMFSKTPESAACRIVVQKHPEMELKTVQNYYSDFKDS